MSTRGDQVTAPWSVTYHDGSGNGHRFQRQAAGAGVQYSYTPVTPAESSTGTYSGGAPREAALDDEAAAELWRLVEQLEADASLRAPSRVMGSGMFQLSTPAGQRRFIIQNGPELRRFEAFTARATGGQP